jgi:hypothetical protein
MAQPRIDVERFVALTLALAAAHCAPAAAPAPPARAIVAEAPPEPAEPPRAAEPAETSEPPDTVELCDNDVGEVSCPPVSSPLYGGPACEGYEGTCGLLRDGYGYKKRAAAEIARCWAAEGPRACDIFVRKRCIRRSLAVACPDPAFEPHCANVLARCRARGQKPSFTQEECVKTLSSLTGENLAWARDGMGPSAEGCSLLFPVF